MATQTHTAAQAHGWRLSFGSAVPTSFLATATMTLKGQHDSIRVLKSLPYIQYLTIAKQLGGCPLKNSLKVYILTAVVFYCAKVKHNFLSFFLNYLLLLIKLNM